MNFFCDFDEHRINRTFTLANLNKCPDTETELGGTFANVRPWAQSKQ